MLVLGLRSGRPGMASRIAAGFGLWTLVEYLVHRPLHGRFPDGDGAYAGSRHKYFDPLHWEDTRGRGRQPRERHAQGHAASRSRSPRGFLSRCRPAPVFVAGLL